MEEKKRKEENNKLSDSQQDIKCKRALNSKLSCKDYCTFYGKSVCFYKDKDKIK